MNIPCDLHNLWDREKGWWGLRKCEILEFSYHCKYKFQHMLYNNIYIHLTIQSFNQRAYTDSLFLNHSVGYFLYKDE